MFYVLPISATHDFKNSNKSKSPPLEISDNFRLSTSTDYSTYKHYLIHMQ